MNKLGYCWSISNCVHGFLVIPVIEKAAKHVLLLNVINVLKCWFSSSADNAKLQEFLELMQPRSKAKSWGNDDLLVEDDLHSGKAQASASSDHGLDDTDELESTEAREDNKQQSSLDVNFEMSDMDYLHSRVSTAFDMEEEEDEEGVESQVRPLYFCT